MLPAAMVPLATLFRTLPLVPAKVTELLFEPASYTTAIECITAAVYQDGILQLIEVDRIGFFRSGCQAADF